MTIERFTIDANILVYTLDTDEHVKSSLSREVVRRAAQHDCVMTIQALGEFFSVSVRKRGVSLGDAAQWVQNWLALFRTGGPDERALRSALAYATTGRASYWDALLMATAAENGCTAVVTEDMADGAMFGSTRVVHPFDGERLSEAVLALLG